nr:hypothetical protein BJQ95_01151 [Cryobacterium sp. SO1]
MATPWRSASRVTFWSGSATLVSSQSGASQPAAAAAAFTARRNLSTSVFTGLYTTAAPRALARISLGPELEAGISTGQQGGTAGACRLTE